LWQVRVAGERLHIMSEYMKDVRSARPSNVLRCIVRRWTLALVTLGFLVACPINYADEKSGGIPALSGKRSGNATVAKDGGIRRTLHFPRDRSLGRLWVYGSDTDLAQLDEHACVEARGDVDVPAGKLAGLQYVDPRIKTPAADQPWDLSPLDDLRPTDLDFLMFVFARLPTDELKRLTRHTSLRMLSIGISEMNEDGLASIGKIASLEGLTFGEIKMSDKGLAHLKDLHNLRRLHLGSGGITNEGLPYLAKLNKLEELDLTWASITDAGLAHLASLTEMRKLHLGRTKIKGAGLVHLAGMKSLQRLDLADTDLGDQGLKPLESLRSLRWLDLSRTKVTQAGVTALRRQLPGTEIVSDLTGK
jgi:hypothetical protein